LTLIVGILCTDGVVMASDSAATFGKEGKPTIGQQKVNKLIKLSDSIIYSGTGAVGISQLLAHNIEEAYNKQAFKGIKAPEEMMHKIGVSIGTTLTPYLKTAQLTYPLVKDASTSLCQSLVAIPVKQNPYLFTFDFNGAPEMMTPELPFVSLGSGQPHADPFLALLKRLLWTDSQPTLAQGRLVAVWTIDHVREIHPGGVGGDIQLAILSSSDGGKPTVTMISEPEIQEHLEQIRAAEEALIQEITGQETTEEIVSPPPSPPEDDKPQS
jgi:ATP-dependent protease HslVU (ClpYQ) peptidase subunit